MRCEEPGWEQLGIYDNVGRRSVWIRSHDTYFELCSGREGDDGYVRVDDSNPIYHDLLDVLSYQTWAMEVSLSEGSEMYWPPSSRYGVCLAAHGIFAHELWKTLPDGKLAFLSFPDRQIRGGDYLEGVKLRRKLLAAVRAAREWKRRATTPWTSGLIAAGVASIVGYMMKERNVT